MIWRDRSDPIATQTTGDAKQIARFAALAEEWWDPDGPFRTLHRLNPVRLSFIRGRVCRLLGRDPADAMPFAGLTVLDIGCGGGLVAEPVAFWGGQVMGIDASAQLVEVARLHAALVGAPVHYRHALVEELVASGARFDVILNTEVVEHVAEPDLFLESCCRLLNLGGIMVIATLNRSVKSLLFAKIVGEYWLNLVPRGTHDWRRFIRPRELAAKLARQGVVVEEVAGVSYNPLLNRFRISSDASVNYLAVARRPPLRVAASRG